MIWVVLPIIVLFFIVGLWWFNNPSTHSTPSGANRNIIPPIREIWRLAEKPVPKDELKEEQKKVIKKKRRSDSSQTDNDESKESSSTYYCSDSTETISFSEREEDSSFSSSS